jgi:hypothetical protein
MTHTPGPWKAHPADTDSTPHFGHLASDIWGITDSGETAIVARVYHAETTAQDNENLILAAPDLLEALKALLESIESVDFSSPVQTDGLYDRIPWAQAEAAIDKAKGQEQDRTACCPECATGSNLNETGTRCWNCEPEEGA